MTYHPRAGWLGLNANERIVNLSAAGIRISVLTDGGRVATLLDESIGKQMLYTYKYSINIANYINYFLD